MSNHAKYLEHVLHYFDEDGDGKISPLELKNRVGLINCDTLLLKEAEDTVESLDSDGDGLLGLEDLTKLMELSGGEEERVKDLRLAYNMYIDVEVSEFISPKSLKRMLSKLGESKSADECELMINHFDLNGDGFINFEEFRIMME